MDIALVVRIIADSERTETDTWDTSVTLVNEHPDEPLEAQMEASGEVVIQG